MRGGPAWVVGSWPGWVKRPVQNAVKARAECSSVPWGYWVGPASGGRTEGSAPLAGGTPFEGGLSPSTPSLLSGRLHRGDISSIRRPRRRPILSLASLLTSGARWAPRLFGLSQVRVFSWWFPVPDARERQIQVPPVGRSGTFAWGAAELGARRTAESAAVHRWRGRL